MSKTRLILQSVKYLGTGVSDSGFSVDIEKIQAVLDYPVPQDRRELDRLLGMTGWFQKFIASYSTIAEPLFNLWRKEVPWSWSEDCQSAFEMLKTKLCSAPVLAHPQPGVDFQLHTDASGVGLGVSVHQVQNGVLKTIGFSSRTLNFAERKYSTVEREILAVVWGLEKWRHLIESSHILVITDHQALAWLFKSKSTDTLPPRLYRWILRVQEFDIEVKYRPGKLNVVPDALSRNPRYQPILSIGLFSTTTEPEEKCAALDCILTGEIIDWIQCDQCDRWFHDQCVGVNPEEADEIDFVCPFCKVSAEEGGPSIPTVNTGVDLPSSVELFRLQMRDPDCRPIMDYLTGDKSEFSRTKLVKDCVLDQVLVKRTIEGTGLWFQKC